MHSLSLLLGLLALSTPSLAAPFVPLYTYGGRVKPGSYIVKLQDGSDQTTILGFLASLVGANNEVTHRYSSNFYNAFAGDFDDKSINALMLNPNVEYVAQNGYMSTFDSRNDEPWNLARISTPNKLSDQDPLDLTNTYNYGSNPGNGVDIYVVDTGIYTEHEDFQDRAQWGETFCDGCMDADGNGHGTHVAGTAGGTRFGVAKSASLIAVKVLDDLGSGVISDIISGLDYVQKQHKASGRPSIATMSLGGSYSFPINDAVTKLINDGIHCTVAAGNSDEDALTTSPASTPQAITVGATDITDSRAFYSNYGFIVDIFAPGSNVTSTWNNGGVNTISGTSMATPAVAGLVAYYLSTVNPKMTPAEMSNQITSRATSGKLTNIPFLTPNRLAFNSWSA